MVDKEEMGASLFSRTLDFMDNDPLEEIFALNMGDFVSEFLISEDLANKVGKSAKDKVAKLKSQLQELMADLGLDLTTYFTMAAKQAIREQRIPFEISRDHFNAETLEAFRED